MVNEGSGSSGAYPAAAAGFSGALSATPLFAVMRRIQRERLSGTLSVLREEQVRQLFFERGELRSARSSREDHRVGATLVRWGYITERQLQDALEVQRQSHQRIDQILVEQGLVTRAIVDSEARRQMQQVIFSTLAWPDGAFHFEPNTGIVELDVEVSFFEDVIIEGIRRIPESEQFVELLGDLQSVPRLTKDPMNSNAFRLLKDSVDVLEHIDGKTPYDQLLKSATTSGSAAAKILYSLLFAGLIEAQPPGLESRGPGESVQPVGESVGDQTQPVAKRATAETSKTGKVPIPGYTGTPRQIVLDTYRQLDWLSHYDLLGVARKATRDDIDQAFKNRSRLFDPSLKAHPELVDLWRQLTVLAKWLKVAYGVLSDPAKRAAYDRKIAESTPPPEAGLGSG
ncbi:MAG TPA: DUF4388 domain-containing protein [Thermoanaerobaculia bacterium]|nr:DUF4388 domain-containing protein [Thermoanaerobaculia bacterium]